MKERPQCCERKEYKKCVDKKTKFGGKEEEILDD